MPIFLHGLALQNYRGIGPKVQKLSRFKQFNIFIGANNSGKSSVLNFISKFLPLPSSKNGQQNSASLTPLEHYHGGTLGPVVMQMGVPVDTFVKAVLGRYPGVDEDLLGKLCNAFSDDAFIWLRVDEPFGRDPELVYELDKNQLHNLLSDSEWRRLWGAITRQQGGGVDQHWIPETLARIASAQDIELPQTKLIPAIRQIELVPLVWTGWQRS
jgi:hypothetical protein